VDCVVTSPPYWQLRDYGGKGQIGREPTVAEYIERLCAVFDEVKRVLKPSGTCWVNLGDTYASCGRTRRQFAGHRPGFKVQAKSLVLIPFRFAVEMVDRGWRLRNVIIWQKPNCLPSSARDRFTVDFEYLFFFARSGRYFFSPQYEPVCPSTIRRVERFRANRERFDPRRHQHSEHRLVQTPFDLLQRICQRGLNPHGRNRRCVWRIPVRGFPGAHFAVYPKELVETPIRSGCPTGGLVLDPFFGTGTTGLVARDLRRRFIGIELSADYVRLACRRLRSTSPSSRTVVVLPRKKALIDYL